MVQQTDCRFLVDDQSGTLYLNIAQRLSPSHYHFVHVCESCILKHVHMILYIVMPEYVRPLYSDNLARKADTRMEMSISSRQTVVLHGSVWIVSDLRVIACFAA